MPLPIDDHDNMPALPHVPPRVFVHASPVTIPDANGHQSLPLSIELPGSKYYTLRYLLNALLAEGESIVRFPALSEDTVVLVQALRALGASVTWEPVLSSPATASSATSWQARIRGTGGKLTSPPNNTLSVGNAGAVLRLLLGLGALLPTVIFITDHPLSLGQRPNADLLEALAALGVQMQAQGSDGRLPITLHGGVPQGGSVTISGARSSQYLSALLYLAPVLPQGLDIQVRDGLRSQPLVRATLRALAAAGIQVEAAPDLLHFHVPGGQTFQAATYVVPGDGPSAAALAAAALIRGKALRLARLAANEADVRGLWAALRSLGTEMKVTQDEAELATLELGTNGQLHGARIDGDACIDSVPALAAAACFAEGESVFEQVATLRLKESNRIGDLCTELQRAGADARPGAETITVVGRPEGIAAGVLVQGHDDHRLVQALALLAMRSRHGLTIDGADAVSKSYPNFFEALTVFGAEVREVAQ